mgnify:FL=1|jgi:hypothetical protein|tara:strand:+ start:1247 stop:1714 length:468 start_codon:yes stop_codon:yes gene_type:complete
MICGIDPGLSGGIAFLGHNHLEVLPMPISTLVIANKKRRYIDILSLCNIFIARNTADYCFIEKQQAMPNQGLSSTFKTGLGYGILLGVSNVYFESVVNVRAREWKKFFNLSSDKEEARALASELYPDYKHFWKLKKHDGLAESVLIAHWGKHNGK